MTIANLIRTVDRIRPNGYQWDQKIAWIGEIESQIYEDIVITHENPMGIRRPMIDKNTDPDTVLIAPFPHDKLYEYWLMCMIDFNNQEIGKYNNSSTMFNNALISFRDYWNRKYMAVERVPFLSFDNGRHRRHMPYDGRPLYSMGNPLDIQPGRPRPPMRPGMPPMGPEPIPPDPAKHLHDDIMDIRAKNRMQDKDIEKLKAVEVDEALTAAELGGILDE